MNVRCDDYAATRGQVSETYLRRSALSADDLVGKVDL
jgi:hypothetical protein